MICPKHSSARIKIKKIVEKFSDVVTVLTTLGFAGVIFLGPIYLLSFLKLEASFVTVLIFLGLVTGFLYSLAWVSSFRFFGELIRVVSFVAGVIISLKLIYNFWVYTSETYISLSVLLVIAILIFIIWKRIQFENSK